MPAFHKILVAVDFSGHAAEAVRIASELSRLCGAPLTLAHVYQIPVFSLGPAEGAWSPPPEIIANQLASIELELARSVAQAKAAGAVGVERMVRQGVVADELIELVRAAGFDLIAMGTHGRSGLKHMLLGSIAEHVVRRATCAVLTARLPVHHDLPL